MLRIFSSAIVAAVLCTSAAEAAYAGHESELSPMTFSESDAPRANASVAIDSVISIGAQTTMNTHDAIVTAPGKGKIIAKANADVFCSGEETARELAIDVAAEGSVVLDFCEAHLERRDVTIRFVAAP